MKKANLLLIAIGLSLCSLGQQKPPYEASRMDQVMSHRALQAKYFLALPTFDIPTIPSYVPDSLRYKAMFKLTGNNGFYPEGFYGYKNGALTRLAWSDEGTPSIWNQGAARQGADFWITGTGKFGYADNGRGSTLNETGLRVNSTAGFGPGNQFTYLSPYYLQFSSDQPGFWIAQWDKDARQLNVNSGPGYNTVTNFNTVLRAGQAPVDDNDVVRLSDIASKQDNLTFGRGVKNTSNTITLDTTQNYNFTKGLTLSRASGPHLSLVNGTGTALLTGDNKGGLTIAPNNTYVAPPAGHPTALHVVDTDEANFGIVNDAFGHSGGIFFGRRSQGTAASPTPTLGLQTLVDFAGAGYAPSGWAESSGSMRIQAAKTFTDTNHGTMFTWYVKRLNTAGGEVNLKPVMQLTPDGALNITDLYDKIGGLITPTNTGSRPSLTINNNTSKDSSAIASDLIITPTYVQTGTAGSANIYINRTETTLGSGSQKFASWLIAGAEKFSVDRTGLVNGQRVFANATAGTTAEDMGVIKNGTANFGLTNYNNAANMTNGSIIGQFAFNAYENSSILGVARITGYYSGNGTTRYGDLGFSVQNNGSYNELIRLSGNNISLNGKILMPTGANKSIGQATLVAGTVTVSNTSVTANSLIFLTVPTAGGTRGTLTYTISAGTSFTITSSSNTDTSTVNYQIIN